MGRLPLVLGCIIITIIVSVHQYQCPVLGSLLCHCVSAGRSPVCVSQCVSAIGAGGNTGATEPQCVSDRYTSQIINHCNSGCAIKLLHCFYYLSTVNFCTCSHSGMSTRRGLCLMNIYLPMWQSNRVTLLTYTAEYLTQKTCKYTQTKLMVW